MIAGKSNGFNYINFYSSPFLTLPMEGTLKEANRQR